MFRKVLISSVVALVLVPMVATPATAAGDWDPNDVPGHFDLRWVGARWLGGGRMLLTVSFYGGFDRHEIRDGAFSVVQFLADDEPIRGGLLWRNPKGNIVFAYGDTGSGCCWKHGLTWLTPTSFRVRFGWRSDEFAIREITRSRGLTSARVAGHTVRDWTRRFPV
jgi:hypothetical protein